MIDTAPGPAGGSNNLALNAGAAAGGLVLDALADPEVVELVDDELVCDAFESTQAARRAVMAQECRLIAEIEQRRLYRREGHATIYGWLRAHYGYSDAECRTWVTIARAANHLRAIVECLAEGGIPIAHAEVLSKAVNDCAADRGVDPADVERQVGFWLNETGREYGDFRDRVDQWSTELRADQTITEDQAKRDSRYCHIRRQRNNMFKVDALLDAANGAKLIEVWGEIAGGLFDDDWAEAAERHGDDTTSLHLERTNDQRHADALVAMAELAHTNPNSGFSSKPLVSILVDEHTLCDAMISLGLYPTDARLPREHLVPTQRACRTNTGVPLHPLVAAEAAIAGHVRFTMVDKLMRPLKTTSRTRLFTGAMRDAIMAVSPTCIHPGCNRPVNRSQADHTVEHHQGGTTSLNNGTGPLCGLHNRFKHQHRYHITQDTRGIWRHPNKQPGRQPAKPEQTRLAISQIHQR